MHLFVFYYGIMGDITPPVGLATFAAAAISGEDAIKTGIQGSIYALRTVILPFIWIFNPQLLLIDIHSTGELIRVVRGLQHRHADLRRRDDELVPREEPPLGNALLARPWCCCSAPTSSWTASRRRRATRRQPRSSSWRRTRPPTPRLAMIIKGTTLEGDEITKTVALQLGEAGADGRKRLADAGLQLVPLGAAVQVGAVKFGSRAKRGGFESGWDVAAIKVPTGAPSPHWFYLPALLLIGLVWWNQGRRMRAA